MKLFDRLINDGRLFKATPRRLGDKEFLTLLYLDPVYGDAWKEIGISFLQYIEDRRVKTLWFYLDPVIPYPIVIPGGSVIHMEIAGDTLRVTGLIDPAILMYYDVTRLSFNPPRPAETETRPQKRKGT